MEWTLYRDDSGFDALRDEWNDLLGRSRFDTIFLTHEWQSTWWRHLGQGRGPLFILAVREAGRLVAILPLYVQEHDGPALQAAIVTIGCQYAIKAYFTEATPATERYAIQVNSFGYGELVGVSKVHQSNTM